MSQTAWFSFVRWGAGALVLLHLSCSGQGSSRDQDTPGGGGSAASVGGSNTGGMPSGTGGSPEAQSSGGSSSTGGTLPLGPDGFSADCPEDLLRPSVATQTVQVQLDLRTNDEPFVFGEPNSLQAGGTVLPTNFRFYLSQFSLYRGEERHPATLVDAEGAALAYGVQLVNAEDQATLSFDLASEPGEYDGISFLLGLSHGCNQAFQPLKAPLDDASQLKWPHVLGFLFLRFEGNLDQLADPETPNEIHMGSAAGDAGFAPEFFLSLPQGQDPGTLSLTVALDAILEAAAADTDLSDFYLPPPAPPTIDEEVLAGERLRRAALDFEIFSTGLEQ